VAQKHEFAVVIDGINLDEYDDSCRRNDAVTILKATNALAVGVVLSFDHPHRNRTPDEAGTSTLTHRRKRCTVARVCLCGNRRGSNKGGECYAPSKFPGSRDHGLDRASR
jgi:hypothetical protein